MNIKKVMVAGGGTLGSQIAWQIAFSGFEVTVYDAFEQGVENCKLFHNSYANLFLNERGISQDKIDQTLSRLKYTTDIKKAALEADIVSESVPENIEIKRAFYQQFS